MYLQGFHSTLRAGRAVALLAVVLLIAAPAPSPHAAASGPHAPAAPACASTSTLYDGALGGTPGTQGLLYQSFAVSATQTFSNGVTILDTTSRQSDLAGYIGNPASVPALDRTSGYTLTFGVQVVSEAHSNNDRAGFSIIALSQDKLGIELGFWSDHIWAQEGGTTNLFTHAEDAPFTTTTGLISYTLAIHGETYALAANGAPLLSHNLRDYSAFIGPIDPYETPNFIFLGDDTSSARAKIKLAAFAVTVTKCTRYLPLIIVAG